MTVKIINHFEQADIFPSMLKKDVTRKFHQLAGWDSKRRSIIGAASMLAGATWSDILEATADLLSLPLPTVMAWHESIGPLHGNDKPVNDLQLDELIKKLKSMGLIVCVCTSDSRASAEMALKVREDDEATHYRHYLILTRRFAPRRIGKFSTCWMT